MSLKTDPDALAMPPPPLPIQDLILGPELQALSTSLNNAVVKTGQIYSFYADRAKLQHSYKPPDSLVASVGREVEKYDQLCDLIESHLSRAIAVLKRDLKREEQRKKDAALAAAAKTRAADSLRPTETVANLEAPLSQDAPIASTSSPVAASAGSGRRPSAISISSLQRPTAPLKLDLSATALRMSEDPALFSGGLASPVTLAPKSARPLGSNEFPPEFMAALASAAADPSNRDVDIDLTVDGNDARLPLTLDPAVGSSADKPIELDLDSMDLDMVDLFGDTGGSDESPNAKTIDGLFSLHKAPSGDIERNDHEKSQKEEGHFLASFTGDGGNGMFSHQNKAPGADNHHHDVPSILSAFSPPDQPGAMGPPPNTTTNTVPGDPSSFDFTSLDLANLSSSFFSNAGETDMTFSMDEFLNMGGNTGEAKGNAMDVS